MTTAVEEYLDIHAFRKFIQSIDWFADFSDMAGVSRHADEQKAKANELAKASAEHLKSLRDYSRYVYRGFNRDNDWEERLRPEWDGPDDGIKLWRLSKNEEFIQILKDIGTATSEIRLLVSPWKLNGKTYWANRPYVSENSKSDIVEYRLAVSDEIFDLLYSIRQHYFALFDIAKEVPDLKQSDLEFIANLSHQVNLYRYPIFFGKKYFKLDDLKWNMTV